MEIHGAERFNVQSSNDDNTTVIEHQGIETGGQFQETFVDTPGEEPLPDISLTWSLDPTTHSFSSDSAPTLRLFLTSHATRPITFYNESLKPNRLLAEGKLSLFDHTNKFEVAQLKTRFCNLEPPSKVKVLLRENMFHTLYPEVPVAFATPFGRSDRTPEAMLRNHVEVRIDSDHPRHNRKRARGVDGLEVGHHYRLRAREGWGYIRWWEYGEKEEVMNPPGGRLDGRTVAYRHLKSPHRGIPLETNSLSDIDFWCVE